jgi:hypothetical protein
VDKIIKRIAWWRGKLLTQAGRLILIKTCLASIPMYLMSFFKFSRWAIDLLNSHMANCFWDDYEGLGTPDIKDLNLRLLGSWVKRYFRDEGKLWRKVVEKKYCKKENIFCFEKKHASLSRRG